MKNIAKKFASGITPPIFKSIKKRVARLIGEKAFYAGVYSKASEVKDQDPWNASSRLVRNKAALEWCRSFEGSKAFIPNSEFQGTHSLIAFFINLLSSQGNCRILDFSGGTGNVFYSISPFLLQKENVHWHVVDSASLIQLGRSFKKVGDNISFSESLPQQEFDIVFINCSLQYLFDYQSLLSTLLSYKPKFLLLTRLLAGDIKKSFITCQNNVNNTGLQTPALFLNINELISFLESQSYRLISKAPAPEDAWSESWYQNVPLDLQLRQTLNLLFSAQ